RSLLLFFEEFGELGQPASLFAWSSVLAGAAFWRRLEQTGVEPQPRDEADMTTNRGDQIERRETGIGEDDVLALRHPAPNWENGLAGPIRQFFGTASVCGVVTFGGR